MPKNPESAIRYLVEKVVSEARESGWRGPPFDPNILAKISGFQVISSNLPYDALIDVAGMRILVNESSSQVRKRFSVAHEIVHALFPDFGKPDPDNKLAPFHYRIDAQSPVEQLCQLGASIILMPDPEFTNAVSAHPPSLNLAKRISCNFEVSIEAAVRRIVQSASDELYMAVLTNSNKPSELPKLNQFTFPGIDTRQPPKKLRIKWVISSSSAKCFLPKHKSVPDDSALYNLLPISDSSSPSDSITAHEDWSDIGISGKCRIEAQFLSPVYGEQDYILSLLCPQDGL